MKKTEAIDKLGGTVADAARACGITPSAVSQWPDELPRRIEDRVIAAIVRREAASGRARRPRRDAVATAAPAEAAS